jgi:hypothetical protein
MARILKLYNYIRIDAECIYITAICCKAESISKLKSVKCYSFSGKFYWPYVRNSLEVRAKIASYCMAFQLHMKYINYEIKKSRRKNPTFPGMFTKVLKADTEGCKSRIDQFRF